MAYHSEWHMDTHCLGRRVLIYDHVESTNTLAADLANDPDNDGLVILAREQAAGRGQYGRSWHCPAGMGVLLSVLLFPPPNVRRPVLLAAWAAVAVCETIRQAIGLQARIKWPNDVLVHGRKVCGILIECKGSHSPRNDLAVVAGIGLNVNQSPEHFAAVNLPGAGSLARFTDKGLDCEEIARSLIGNLDTEYQRLCEGNLTTLEACWKWHVGLLGKQVEVEAHQGEFIGRLREMTWDALEVEQPDGSILHLAPETVRHLAPA